jgi:hypothetical protein
LRVFLDKGFDAVQSLLAQLTLRVVEENA